MGSCVYIQYEEIQVATFWKFSRFSKTSWQCSEQFLAFYLHDKQTYFLIGSISILIIWFCSYTYYLRKNTEASELVFSYFPSLFNFCSIHLIVFYFLCSLLRVENKQIQRVIRNYVVNDILNSQLHIWHDSGKAVLLFRCSGSLPLRFSLLRS